MAKVDPDTLQVVSDLSIKKQGSQGHLAGGFGRVWVLTGDGSRLAGIDPASNRVSISFTIPCRGVDVTVGPTGLWVPCTIDDRVVLVDPETGHALVDAEVMNPLALAADADDPSQVWVGTATAVLRLDPDSGKILTSLDGGARNGGMSASHGLVWVRDENEDFLVVIDEQSGKRIARVASRVPGGGDVIAWDGAVWTTA